MKNIFLLALLFSLSTSTYISAQSQPTQKELFAPTYHNSKTIVKSKDFYYVGETVFQHKKREHLNSETNRLRIKKSKISGEVISLKNENKTIDVTGKISDYQMAFNDDKQEILIAFNVKTASDTVKIVIEVIRNGNSFLTATSTNGTTISWVGKLKKG